MTAFTRKYQDGGSIAEMVRAMRETEIWCPVHHTYEHRDLRAGMSRMHGCDQIDLFEQPADGVASVKDVPRAIRAHKGRVNPG